MVLSYASRTQIDVIIPFYFPRVCSGLHESYMLCKKGPLAAMMPAAETSRAIWSHSFRRDYGGRVTN